MDQNVPDTHTAQYHDDHVRQIFSQLQQQPSTSRSCKDRTCYILFIIITITFLAVGFHYIRTDDMRTLFKAASKLQTDPQYIQLNKKISLQNVKLTLPTLISVMALAVVLALAMLCLLLTLPTFTFIAILILAVLAIFGVSGLFFYVWALAPAITLSVLGLVLTLIQIYSIRKIRNGIRLLQIASKFIKQTPSILVTPFFMLIFIITLQIFWGLSFIGILIANKQVNKVLAALWIFFNLFYVGFFYYCTSFIVATSAAHAFYNNNSNFLLQGLEKILKYHLGSITKATLLLPFVFCARRHFASTGSGQTSLSSYCCCLLTCCLKDMKDTFLTLNHNAIITMSVTGQNYINSAETALSIIFQNIDLYFVVDLLSHLILVSGAAFVAGVTGMLGYILLGLIATNPQQTSAQVIGTILLFIFGYGIGIIFLSIFSQTFSSMFIIFCIRLKFMAYNYSVALRIHRYLAINLQKFNAYLSGEQNIHISEQQKRKKQQINNNNNSYFNPNINQNPLYTPPPGHNTTNNPYGIDETDPNTYVRQHQY